MKSILRRKQKIITVCDQTNPDFLDLYKIFTATLQPQMSFRHFTRYYYSQKLQYIDVTFLYDGDQLVGFCAAAFYSFDEFKKSASIGRSATGFVEDYQGKSLPKWVLYYKYIRYKQKYPLRYLILTAYVANPLVYSMICKYTAIVYPRDTVQVTDKIRLLKESVLSSSGLTSREASPFAVKIHFTVHKGEKLLHRIKESTNRHVRFYMQHTPPAEQMTLLVIIPISWTNITLTSGRFIKYAFIKSCQGVFISFPGYVMYCKNKSATIISGSANYYRSVYTAISFICKKHFINR